jgi:mRNA interferase RelE/StbE
VGRIQEKTRINHLYDIEISPEAQRGLLSISRASQRQIKESIDRLALDPRPEDSKLLIKAENLRRLRVGDHRVIYGIRESLDAVTIEMVRHRSKGYTFLNALKIAVRSRSMKYSK